MNEQTKIDDGGSAFPIATHSSEGFAGQYFDPGMTLRDYFAKEAMGALLILQNPKAFVDGDTVAENAYNMADSMLRERQKNRGRLNTD